MAILLSALVAVVAGFNLAAAPPGIEPALPAPTGEAAGDEGVDERPESIDASAPVRVVIDAIDVDAEIVPLGLEADGAMEVPAFGLAGWYEPGPLPGQSGPAVIAAHIDSTDGPDVFHRLRDLEPGDVIEVHDEAGNEHTWTVDGSEQHPKDALPVDRIWNNPDGPELRLITCAGAFDHQARTYLDNTVVWASNHEATNAAAAA